MNTATKTSRKDIYQEVTDIIIAQLETGTIPWYKTWSGSDSNLLAIPQNFTSGNYYQGINIVLLWSSALKNKFPTSNWATYNQWNDRNEVIKKDEKGSLVVYYNTIEKENKGEIEKIPFLKSYKVFNRSQLVSYVTGEKEKNENYTGALFERIDPVDQFIFNTNAIIEHQDGGAYYIPSKDKIVMPNPVSFFSTSNYTATENYYSVLLHELTHWTGHEKRLNRNGGKKFGDAGYANEELVAELGAAFLCAGFGIASAEKGNYAAYIDHWLKVLKEDKKCIFTAASAASKSAEYLDSLQPHID